MECRCVAARAGIVGEFELRYHTNTYFCSN